MAIVVTPLMVTLCMLWLRSQFVTKVDFAADRARIDALFHAVDARLGTEKVERDQRYDAVKDRLSDHDARVRIVEKDVARPPTRHELNNAVQIATAGVHSLGKSVDQLRGQMIESNQAMLRQMETLSSYVHSIIEKRL